MNTAESTSRRSKLELGGWLVVLLSTATVTLSTCVLPNDIDPAIELSLSADSVSVGLGATAAAPVEVLSGGTAYSGVQVSLQSGDTSIVAVGTGGSLTGVRRGTAAIEVQLVSSASGGGTLPSAQFTAKVVAASLDVVPQSTDTVTALGDSVRLVPVLRDAGAVAVDDTVSCVWQVSDSTVAVVNPAGWVTAHRAGAVTVTATAPWDGKSGSHTVTVVQEVVTVQVYPARTDTLTAIGDTASFVARAKDRNDSTVAAATFTWSSANAAVATVTAVDAATALVMSQGRGAAEITASVARLPESADSLSGRDTVVVWQVPQQALLTGPDSQPGDVVGGPFTLTAADANGHATPVNVATVFDLSTTSPDGAFYLDAAGSTPASMVTIAAGDSTVSFYYKDIRPGPQTLTAAWTSGDGIGNATHSVTIVTVAVSVTATPAGASVSGVGATLQLTAEARDGHGFVIPNPAVTWASLNANVATINAGGLVTAVASGQVTVRAEVDAVEAYAVVTVAAPAATGINLWAPRTSGTSESLRAVWGISPRDAFTVGTSGTVLRYDGSSWSAVTSGTTQGLNDVWGTSASDVYVAGASGTILHYDGTTFSAGTSGTSEHLLGVWGASPGDVYAVGEAGTILHYNGSSWSAATSGTTESLHGVWGTSAGDIFAVGSGGTVLHWDGNSWTSLTSGTTEDLYAVWGTSASNVYAVGALGTILRYGGSSWSAETSGTTEDLRAVWGTSSNAVFAVGAAGVLTRYGGTSWSQVSSGVTQGLLGVWGTSSGSGFAVGSAGAILRGYPGATVSVTPDAPPTLTYINETVQLAAAARDADGTAVGSVTFTWSSSNETVATVNAVGLVTAVANGAATITATAPGGAAGTTTITVAQEVATVAVSPSGGIVSGAGTTQQFSVEARDAGGSLIPAPSLSVTWTSLNTNVATIHPTTGLATAVASGQVTVAAEVDGLVRYALLTVAVPGATPVTIWSTMVSGAVTGLSGVWGTSATDVYAVNIGGQTLHFDGVTWDSLSLGFWKFEDVWGTSATDVFAVGYDMVAHHDGTNWNTVLTGYPTTLRGIWGASPVDVFVVGDAGTILHYDGTTWIAMESGTTGGLGSVWGTSATNVFAAGTEGIFHYDGMGWSLMAGTTDYSGWSVWGSSATDVYAVTGGAALHYDGTSWTEMASGGWIGGQSVWGSSPSDVYAAGWSWILRYNGTSWSEMASEGTDFRGVWGTSAGDVYVVDYVDGTILRGVRGATVVVTPGDYALTAIGDTVRLTAQARDATNNPFGGVPFLWSSSVQSVATVDATGLVTAVGSGATTITATATGPGGVTGTATVRVIPQFSTISDGARGSCGITPGHALYCWGDNSEGQLANGTYTLSTVPVRVADSLRFSSVDAMGNLHRCAVTVNGTAYCWGTDVNGQLGDGAATHPDCPGGYACSNVLVKVTGDLEFTTVSAGDLGHHTCGLVGDAAYCWGSSDHGQLGTVDGSGIPGTFWSPEPLLVPGGLTFIRITAGMYHTCGLTTEGTAFCWGRGDEGQLGHAARTSSAAPVMIAGAVRFTEITAGSQHTCGLTVSGDAYCWGLNDYGQLGSDGVAVGASADTAVLVSAQLAFTSLDAGHRHTCGIAAGGAAYCWGWGVNGALGNGSVADQNTPIPVAGGHVFVSLVGGGHSCGVTTGGDAYCWGQNVYGQLGNGVTESRTVPDRVLFPPP